MARPKVLLLGEIETAHAKYASLVSTHDAEIIIPPADTTRASFLAQCASGAYDGVLVAYRTFGSTSLTGALDAQLLSALPSSLKFICHNGAGYDQIDIPACTARGIRVSNVVSATEEATADCAVFLMLGALRNFAQGLATCRRGEWRGEMAAAGELQGQDPQGKVLGILGMGGIGRCFARKAAAAFGMKVRYYNRTRLSEAMERDEAGGAEWVDFETLLRESDVLSVHVPLKVSLLSPPLSLSLLLLDAFNV